MIKYIPEQCPNCGASEIDYNLTCNYCGSKLIKEQEHLVVTAIGYRCPVCHTDNQEKDDFCKQCGKRLKEKCPFCLQMHPISTIFCPKSGYNIKERREKEEKLTRVSNQPQEKKKKVDVKSLLEQTIEKEKRKR